MNENTKVTNTNRLEGNGTIIWDPSETSINSNCAYEEKEHFFEVSPLNLMYDPNAE